jgi:hypothetical protein
MRQENINKLSEPYPQPRDRFDRRFHSAIGTNVPSANKLVGEIFNDLSGAWLVGVCRRKPDTVKNHFRFQ